MIITPSILTDSLETAQEQVDKILSLGLKRAHIDIIDPEYADEITIHPIDLLEIDLKGLEVNFHLMTNDPINDVLECSQIPGVKTIVAQIERMPSQRDFLAHVQSFSLDTGFSLDAFTDIDELDPELLSEIAIVQVMGNKAGKQGQPFLGEPIFQKIRALDTLRKVKALPFQIAADIGMSPENAKACVSAGADIVTPGSYLWTAPNLQTAIEAYSEKL